LFLVFANFQQMTIGFIGFFYGMYVLFLYKRSGGDYTLKCGVDVNKMEAQMASDTEKNGGEPVQKDISKE